MVFESVNNTSCHLPSGHPLAKRCNQIAVEPHAFLVVWQLSERKIVGHAQESNKALISVLPME